MFTYFDGDVCAVEVGFCSDLDAKSLVSTVQMCPCELSVQALLIPCGDSANTVSRGSLSRIGICSSIIWRVPLTPLTI